MLSIVTELIRQYPHTKSANHINLGDAEDMFEVRIGLLNFHDKLGEKSRKKIYEI